MTPPTNLHQPCLLVVDDEPLNLQVLKQILQADYRLLFARDGERALQLARQEQPDLVLLDIMMPGLTGLETCRALKADDKTASIPVIFVTALNEADTGAEGFAAGAVDYITKPLSAPIVHARVRNHLSLVSAQQLRDTRLQVIRCLGQAAEFKDNETGNHVIRMSHYARVLAESLDLPAAAVDKIYHAAPMHDVGKIGIPDAILQKPGKLDAEEWRVMQTHCEIGARILGDDSSALMRTARTIALYHHEKWDGSGYPEGLAGEAIPLAARIIALADVFDALTSERPYKKAWSFSAAIDFIKSQSGLHFDPNLVAKLDQVAPRFLAIFHQYRED